VDRRRARRGARRRNRGAIRGAPILGRRLPRYSSMRADGIGTKLYFDSLQAAGGVAVSRKYKTLAEAPERDATILFLGESPYSLLAARRVTCRHGKRQRKAESHRNRHPRGLPCVHQS